MSVSEYNPKRGSKSVVRKGRGVQVSPPAPIISIVEISWLSTRQSEKKIWVTIWQPHSQISRLLALQSAANFGHSDTRMTERHYAHLVPSHVTGNDPRDDAEAQPSCALPGRALAAPLRCLKVLQQGRAHIQMPRRRLRSTLNFSTRSVRNFSRNSSRSRMILDAPR